MKLIEEKNRIAGFNENNGMVAEITWQEKDNVLWVKHTFTDPSLRGQGIAAQLVDAAVEKATHDQQLIMPVCPYVVSKFDKEPDKYQHIDARHSNKD